MVEIEGSYTGKKFESIKEELDAKRFMAPLTPRGSFYCHLELQSSLTPNNVASRTCPEGWRVPGDGHSENTTLVAHAIHIIYSLLQRQRDRLDA